MRSQQQQHLNEISTKFLNYLSSPFLTLFRCSIVCSTRGRAMPVSDPGWGRARPEACCHRGWTNCRPGGDSDISKKSNYRNCLCFPKKKWTFSNSKFQSRICSIPANIYKLQTHVRETSNPKFRPCLKNIPPNVPLPTSVCAPPPAPAWSACLATLCRGSARASSTRRPPIDRKKEEGEDRDAILEF